MTNEQIILEAAIANNIFTEEEAVELLETEGTLSLHTFATWKHMGYSIKRGEHAKLCVMLWVPKKKKEKTESDDEEDTGRRMYLRKSFLFGKEQVEKVAA